MEKRAYKHNKNVLRAADYPFSIHKVYIPSDLNEMITKYSKEGDIAKFIKTKNKPEKSGISNQKLIMAVTGKTKNPDVKVLEQLRRLVVTPSAIPHQDYKQLPLIRLKEVSHLMVFNRLDQKILSKYCGTSEAHLSNILHQKSSYKYNLAWALTYFFLEDYEKYRKPEQTWDFYSWVQDRLLGEGKITQEEAEKLRSPSGMAGPRSNGQI